MPINATRFVRPICAMIDDLLIHANVNSPFGRVTSQRVKLAIFAVTVLTAPGTLTADSEIYLDLNHNAAQVQNVCDSLSLSGIDGDARVHVDVANSQEPDGSSAVIQASANALTDFFATSGYSSYNEYLTGLQDGLKRNVTKPLGTVEIEQ